MEITHVIRGDDHVNNTPRQINILKALEATLPQYAHLSMILGDDGQKLSKRHGAVSVMQYDEEGYLREAVINYLARLGWSHGDDEVFSVEQFCDWFNLDHITPAAAQFNTEKLKWLNNYYMKQANDGRLAEMVRTRLRARGITACESTSLESVVALYKERSSTLNELASAAEVFYTDLNPDAELLKMHLTEEALPALRDLTENLNDIAWEIPAISALLKEVLRKHGLKMPKLAMPLRVMLVGQTHTPSVDALIVLFSREIAISRMKRYL
jgi:glutamyl-tRNA synthetase